MGSRRPQRLRGEAGATLVELLMAISLGTVVLAIVFSLLARTYHDTDDVQARTETASTAQLTLRRLSYDLQQASSATVTPSGSGATIALQLPVRTAAGSTAPASQAVTWTCTGGGTGTCTRVAGAASLVSIRGVVSASFTAADGTALAANPSYVAMTLRVRVLSPSNPTGAAASTRQVTVTAGTALRNFAVPT